MELKINSPKYGEKIVLIDDEDFERVKNFKWYLFPTKNKNRFYIASHENGKVIFIHRKITDCIQGLYVDHINHDTLNNQKNNLRICTRIENMRNSNKYKDVKIKKSSKYKGVSFDKSKKKYTVNIRVNRVLKYLGAFSDEKEAALKYNESALKYFGEFAKLNEVTI